MDDLIGRFEEHSRISAELSGLNWTVDGERIREGAKRQHELEQGTRLFDPSTAAKVLPLYHSVDEAEVCGAYVREDIEESAIVHGLLDRIAESAASETAVPLSGFGNVNWLTLVHVIGPAAIAPAFGALRDALASRRVRHVRFELDQWPLDEEGEEIVGEGLPPLVTAPIDTDDDRFVELGFSACNADDADATRIIRFDIDDDLVQALREIVEKRAVAARMALRGDLIAA